MRVGKQKLVVLAALTLALCQSTTGSARIPGMSLIKKDKPQAKAVAKPEVKAVAKTEKKPQQNTPLKPQAEPVVSERLKSAAQNLIAARKQVDVARAQLRAAEAEYKVAKFELGAIALRKQAMGMAGNTEKHESIAENKQATTERIEAPASNYGDLMPTPAQVKPSMAPAPGWNKPGSEEASIDDLDLP